MSKFLNLFAPALGGTALVLAGAYVFATKDYKEQTLASLEGQVAAKSAISAEQEAMVNALNSELASASEAAANMGDPVTYGITYDLGREALAQEVAAWDIDVRPDALGLPEGSGDVWTGEEIFAEQCAACHGDFGEAVDRWPVLAGGLNTLTDDRPVKTIGSYWPYLSTVWDYVNRAMPFGNAQSLEPDEVYAITAYLMYLNDLVDDDFTLSHSNFLEVRLPNEENFYMDDRETTEYAVFTGEPCMRDCKESVEITARARVVDVTPEESGVVEAGDKIEVASAATTEPTGGDQANAALLAEGEALFKKCKTCHQIGSGAKNRIGPQLTGIVGAPIGAVDGFTQYSGGFKAANAEGRVWSDEELSAFLANPKGHIKGTKMNFKGFKEASEIEAIIAYLESFGG